MRKNKTKTSTTLTITTNSKLQSIFVFLFLQNIVNNTLAIFFSKSLNPSMESQLQLFPKYIDY